MANAPATKANAAFVDEDYDLALALYKQVRYLLLYDAARANLLLTNLALLF